MWFVPVTLPFIFSKIFRAVIQLILNTVFAFTHWVKTPTFISDTYLMRPKNIFDKDIVKWTVPLCDAFFSFPQKHEYKLQTRSVFCSGRITTINCSPGLLCFKLFKQFSRFPSFGSKDSFLVSTGRAIVIPIIEACSSKCWIKLLRNKIMKCIHFMRSYANINFLNWNTTVAYRSSQR